MRCISVATRSAHIAAAAGASIALTLGSPALAEEPDPYTMADGSWITINGEVDSVRRDNFTLDYGDGSVIVEMDDGDRDADAYKLLVGDEVSVFGRIDDDLYELTTIEASSVYVDSIGTTFFASSVDEERTMPLWAGSTTVPIDTSRTTVYGIVTEVDDQEFVIDSGLRELRVAVDDMPYNPLDDVGYQKLRVGDRVRVSGEIDRDFFEGRELEAESIIKLSDS